MTWGGWGPGFRRRTAFYDLDGHPHLTHLLGFESSSNPRPKSGFEPSNPEVSNPNPDFSNPNLKNFPRIRIPRIRIAQDSKIRTRIRILGFAYP
jgi:hypothetical protein